ncbi:hypothetical protein L1049_019025 [Liquidambar formosana]|uniref:Uncharacterized protein n=1 Tax=Liquidambar formosana TaxID=63359 RepID=A0AAP0WNW0_LIQFO
MCVLRAHVKLTKVELAEHLWSEMSRENKNSIKFTGGSFNMKGESKFSQGNSVSGSQRQVQVIPPSSNEINAENVQATLEEKANFSQGDTYTFQPEVVQAPEPSKLEDVKRTVSVDGAPEPPEPSKPEVKDVERTVPVDGAPEPPSSCDGCSSDSE